MDIILVVEPGEQSCKERFLRELTSNHYEFFLLVNSSQRVDTNKWYCKYINHDHIIYASFRDPRKAAHSVKKHLKSMGIKLSGVTTYYEEAVLVTQAIAKELSLIPITLGNPLAIRNKGLMRRLLTDARMKQPIFITCYSLNDAINAVHTVGIPCVIKPSEMTASVGVRKISRNDDKEIENAFNIALNEDIEEEDTRYAYNISPEVLVEEYIPTYQEVSCEGYVYKGKMQLIAITRKSLCQEPLFEEIAHAIPYKVFTETETILKTQLKKATQVLKLYCTTFHAEFRLIKGADPVLVEIGARLPGGFIPQLVKLYNGVDMIKLSLQLAIGQEPDATYEPALASAIRFFVDDKSTQYFKSRANQIREFPFIDELALYPNAESGRRGHLIWTAPCLDEIDTRWDIINRT